MTEKLVREIMERTLRSDLDKLDHNVDYIHKKMQKLEGMMKCVMLTIICTNALWVLWTALHHLVFE